LAWIRQFLNFLQFSQAKSEVISGCRDVIVGDVTSSLSLNNFNVARNLHAKFGAGRAVSEFFMIFSSKIHIQSDCRDVIDDVIKPSLLSD
jgi:hypothetical protein